MATTSEYFVINNINLDNANFIDFDLRYGALTTVGESIQYNGSPKKDAIFVRPGLTYDLSNTAGANDKIYLTGSLSDYTLQVDSVNSTLTLTRSSLNESVKVSSGTSGAFDSLIFANGMVDTLALFNAVVANNGTLPALNTGETSLAPLASGGAGVSAVLNATINAYITNQSGGTFASVKPGVNLIVNGSAGVDKVYVAEGGSVNATNLAGAVDQIYLRGNWADYSKALNTVNNTITFTRTINGKSESVIVATGTSQSYDRVIFADGAVSTADASVALTVSLTAPLAGITGYNSALTTPLYNDTQVATALAAIRDAAQGNTATDTTPSLLTYTAAGITGVTDGVGGNLAAINSALNSASVTGSQADTAVNVQTLVDAYAAIVQSADGVANNDTVNPTQAQYAAIGVNGVNTPEEESLLGDVLDTASLNGTATDATAVGSVAKLQALADAVQAVMDGTPTKAQLESLGVMGATDAKIEVIKEALRLASDTTQLNTLNSLQAIVSQVMATNSAPTAITLSANTLAENVTVGSGVEIGTLTVTDPDATGNNNVLSLSGTDAASFGIVAGKLMFTGSSPDFEAKVSYSVTVTSTDGSLVKSQAFTVNVTDVNEVPTAIALSANTLAENVTVGTGVEIGSLTVTDPDANGNNNVLSLSGTDAGSFGIVAGKLMFTGTSPDFEAKASYSVTVTSTDGSLVKSQPFTVNVTDVVETSAIVITNLASSSVAENAAYTSTTPSVSGAIGALTYTLSGTDASLFTVNASTGVVSMIARNFESPADNGANNVYDYTLTATDANGNTDDQAVAVTVTDVVETATLTIGNLASSSVAENVAYTSATPSLTGTPIGAVTYTLGGTDAGLFTVNASTGVVSMIARNFESPADDGANNVYDYTLIATDADGNTDSQIVAVTVTDTTAPTLAITSNVSAVKAGETATITFTFSEAPVGFDASDIVTTGGTLGLISGTGLTRAATFTPTAGLASGTASITVAAGTYTDSATNTGGAGTTPSISIDTLAPTVSITSNVSAVKAGETATITFTFSEDPGTTFIDSDIVTTGGTLGLISGTGLTRTATFTPTAGLASGTASITVAAGNYTDAATNSGAAGTTPSISIDTLAPTIDLNGTALGTNLVEKTSTAVMDLTGGSSGSIITPKVQITPISSSQLSGDLTLEAWVRADASGGIFPRIFDLGNGAGQSNIILGSFNNELFFQVFNANGASSTLLKTTGAPLTFSATSPWTHIALTVDSTGTATFFVNGVARVSATSATAVSYLPDSVLRSSNFIGASNWGGDSAWDGQIRDARIYNAARTATEIAADLQGSLNTSDTNLVLAVPLNGTTTAYGSANLGVSLLGSTIGSTSFYSQTESGASNLGQTAIVSESVKTITVKASGLLDAGLEKLMAGGTLSADGSTSGATSLSLDGTATSGSITVTSGTAKTWAWALDNSGLLTFTASGVSATASEAQNLVRSFHYVNTTPFATVGDRVLSITATDVAGNTGSASSYVVSSKSDSRLSTFSSSSANTTTAVDDWMQTGTGSASVSSNTFGDFLGRFAGDTNKLNGQDVWKRFDFSNEELSGGGLKLTFDLQRLGSWDGEAFSVFMDNVEVMRKHLNTGAPETLGNVTTGSSVNGITWQAVAQAASDFDSSLGQDQVFRVTMNIAPGSVTNINSLRLGFGSFLDQARSDEAYGIDNLTFAPTAPNLITNGRFDATAGANLVTNGTFDGATVNEPGWTIGGSFSVVNGNSNYNNGPGNAARLGYNNGTGSVEQTITTVVGKTYALSYQVATVGSNQTESLTVSALNGASSLSSTTETFTGQNLVYQTRILSFTATSTTSTIRFKDNSNISLSNLTDLLLDNVTVREVIAPTLNGWTTSGAVGLFNNAGNDVVVFGGGGLFQGGALSQTFATTAGATYEVSYAWNTGITPTPISMQAQVLSAAGGNVALPLSGGTGTDQVTTFSDSAKRNMSFQFVADGNASTVQFTNLLDQANNDAFLDNIRITRFDSVATGDTGNNTLVGTNGNNLISGGAGNDLMAGGGGADTFRWISDTGSNTGVVDTVTDFNKADDKLDLWGLLKGSIENILGSSVNVNLDNIGNFIRMRRSGNDAIIDIDYEATIGIGNLDQTIVLTNAFTTGGFTDSDTLIGLIKAGVIVVPQTVSATDTTAPTLTISAPAAGAVSAGSPATFTFSEVVAGFTVSDVTASGGALSNLTVTADPKVYTATFTPATVNGASATLSVAAGSYLDRAGNLGAASNNLVFDVFSPTAKIDLVQSVLNNNAGLTYNFSTGSFYRLDSVAKTWEAANTNAANSKLFGFDGHMVHVNSDIEQTAVVGIFNGGGWIGASDKTEERLWRWHYGANVGQIFTEVDADVANLNNNFAFAKWGDFDPNGFTSENYAETGSATWNDLSNNNNRASLIEWEGSKVLNTQTYANNGGIAIKSTEMGTAYLVNAARTVNSLADIDALNGALWNSKTLTSTPNTVLSSEDFAAGTPTGWSNTSATDLGGALGWFLGRFGGTQAVSKTYDFGAAFAGQTVNIDFDMIEMDTWDGELFKVFINGLESSVQSYFIGLLGINDGGIDLGNRRDVHHYTVQATLDTNGRFTLGFGAALNEDINNESWGIDNVVITTATDTTSLGLGGLVDGTYKLYTADAAGNLSAAAANTITVDTTAPTLSASTAPTTALSTVAGTAGNSAGETITLTVTFDGNVNGLNSGTNNNTVFTVAGNGVNATWGGTNGTSTSTRTLTYTVQAGQNGQAAIDEAALKVALIAGITDATGNAFAYTLNSGNIPNIDAAPLPVIEATAPTVTITDNTAGTANGPVTHTFTFSEAVTGFDASDVILSAGTKGTFTKVNDTTYTLLVMPAAGSGNYTVNVGAGSYMDTTGNSSAAAAQASQDYSFFPSTIDLGTSGKLIAPVQVEGKWYYYWDRSGDGVANTADWLNHAVLNNIFNQDVNDITYGIGTSSSIRYATLNGVKVALPTYGGPLFEVAFWGGILYKLDVATPTGGFTFQADTSYSVGSQTQAARDANPNSNNTYADLLAIWDGHNRGPLTDGTPPDWFFTSYWSATPSSQNNDAYATVSFRSGQVGNILSGAFNLPVALQVLPIVIDLNRDGVLSYGNVVMDVNGDGLLDATRWAGAQDGVLVWDKYGDGQVHVHSQYAFAQYDTTSAAKGKTATDLSGLAQAFDSNHDGVFDAQDAQFADFTVWQDANQNGVSDAGEVKSLAELGLASLSLSSDGVARSPVAGVHEAGQTQFTANEGTKVLVADVGFDFSTLPESLNLSGLIAKLDLSADPAANTLNLKLSDVLALPQQTLVVQGAANDSVLLAGEGWTNTGTLAAQNGHSYAVWHNGSAQALIDQQMMKAGVVI